MIRPVRAFSLPFLAVTLIACAASPALAQTETKPSETKAVVSDKSAAYFNFSMGHLYAEMAGAYGNRGDYLNKAIDYYKAALKQDPSATFLSEELTDLYIQAGQLNRAVTEAEEMLRQNPDNLDARRMLGRIYTRLIGDPQQNKIDEKMLAKSIDQYQIIIEKDPKDQESRLVLARLYRLSRKSVEAEKAYKAVLAADAGNEEALTGLAMVYSDVGDTRAAIEMLRRASEKDPNARSLGALAQFYEQTNDWANAAETWKRVLPLVPDANRLKRNLAQDLLFSDKLDEALTLYKEIAAEDAKDSQVQLRLSEIYRQKRDFVQARAAFAKAKELDAGNMEVRYDEVNLLDAEGKGPEAVKALKAILDSTAKKQYSEEEKRTRSRLLERLGFLYQKQAKYPEALAAFRQIPEADPDQASHSAVQVIETYRLAKNLPAARQESEAALKKAPKDRSLLLLHASLLADEGKTDAAVTELRALMGGQKDRETLLVIAQLYEKGKKYTEEQKTLNDAEAISTTKQEKEAVQFARGAMFERMKDFDAAEAEFRKVLTIDPDNAGALNYLGYMLADRDVRLDEAQKLIGRAVELDPQNGAYLDSLGWVQYRQNRLDQAEDSLRRALDKMSADPTVHDHLGDVYLKEGKLREAVQQWQASLKEWDNTPPSESDPVEIGKVTRKLENARVRIAKEGK
ncbi:MAG: tetratricopeptide repeat protein [Acidobacteriota bacterium]|nr:tetratricopeptide repeat protein [Acidobacteriota bacterium]